ncbi:hypothetical protein SELMODRAFT_177496 [Selaginella moellendorffii]|uniref:Activator of Hsp90 ATPase AHSA1-like N-terminal domain-containing protein n=1 Tax=Selaginella moellendorffii TaxID=88036 RepID=D8S738_SELML|nr:activator of 90 kDa heat shock protein ATPase homolog 1 [Selaginella moellendorffii]EFJ19683.1 hypothetical protein SELMODRAFT_177496 [Selaginella moellendorffii]|eukprot:XP_002979275.1 activator of 90 kDa heat shock protein ATPase homolog 1 [Selaginella moellendorffii]
MAKFGEGDKRWIVEERQDGANVHNWHWAEKDCYDWTCKRFDALFEGLVVLSGEGGLWIKISKVESVKGEAYVNIRKGKIIPGYEISAVMNWEGEAKDGSGNSLATVQGKVELPYIADENADEDPEVKVSVMDETSLGQRLKEAFLAKGKPLVLERIASYVKQMANGGPAQEEMQSKNLEVKGKGSNKPVLDEKVSAKPVEPPKAKAREGFKTITMTERFHCRPRDLYEVLLDENRWKGFTQSNAKVSKEVGGMFSIFDGAVTGVNQELEENRLIVQKWRFANWNDGHYSTVCMTFEEPEIGTTVLKLTQTDVPEEDRFGNATVYETTRRGWKELIFHKIRAVFGYGL